MKPTPLPKKLRPSLNRLPLDKPSSLYPKVRDSIDPAHAFVARVIIGSRTVYGDNYRKDDTKPSKEPLDMNLVSLYQSLPEDQCIQLYGMQKDNMGQKTRAAILSLIGSKRIYGENYVPNKGKK
jgi:hypothetical protein